MLTETITAVFKEMGHTVRVDFLPWKRGYLFAKKGLYAGTFPYINSANRQQDFFYSDPIYTGTVRIFVKRDSTLQYRSEEDLKGLKICLPLGYGVSQAISPLVHGEDIEQIAPETMESCFKLIAYGRADFVAINETEAAIAIHRADCVGKVKALDRIVDEFSYCFIVSRVFPDGKHLVQDFNRALARLRANGRIEEIVHRHLAAGP